MAVKRIQPGSSFLTASQCLQGVVSQPRVSHLRQPDAGDKPSEEGTSKAFQQAPVVQDREAAYSGREDEGEAQS